MCFQVFCAQTPADAPMIIMTFPYYDRIDDELVKVDEGWDETKWTFGHRKLTCKDCKSPFKSRTRYQVLTKFFHPGSFELEDIEYIDLIEKKRHIHIKIHTEWKVTKLNGVFLTCYIQVSGGKNKKARALKIWEDQNLKIKNQLDDVYFKNNNIDNIFPNPLHNLN